jgi:hypothetical protein
VFTLTVDPDLGFSISLSAAALAIVQGASTPTTTVNISRVGHLGAVELGVTGLPTGVTASFDYSLPWLTGNSSVLTLTVGTAVPPGIYLLQVNASNPEQEGVLTTPLTLSVIALPGYDLTLAPSTASIVQGGSSSTLMVSLLRSAFPGGVTLSVENLPTGVSVFIDPDSPISGSSSLLYLWAAGDAPAGTFTNLLVRGVASGLTDRTAPLTLTVRMAPFALTLSSPAVSIAQGAATPTILVNVVRSNFTGPVTLYVDLDGEGSMPPGVTAAFAPNFTTGNSSVLTFTVGAAAVPGVYDLYVWGDATTGWWWYAPLTLTILSP